MTAQPGNHYVASWTMDVLDAESAEQAARMAFAVVRSTDPTQADSACVFEITNQDNGETEIVDLCEVHPGDDPVTNCRRYNNWLNQWEIAPNGDDYNALLNFLGGAEYHHPHKDGR